MCVEDYEIRGSFTTLLLTMPSYHDSKRINRQKKTRSIDEEANEIIWTQQLLFYLSNVRCAKLMSVVKQSHSISLDTLSHSITA